MYIVRLTNFEVKPADSEEWLKLAHQQAKIDVAGRMYVCLNPTPVQAHIGAKVLIEIEWKECPIECESVEPEGLPEYATTGVYSSGKRNPDRHHLVPVA